MQAAALQEAGSIPGRQCPVADTAQFRSYAVDFGIAECSEGGRHYWKVAADTAD